MLYNHGGEKEAELPFTLILKYRKQIKPLMSLWNCMSLPRAGTQYSVVKSVIETSTFPVVHLFLNC